MTSVPIPRRIFLAGAAAASLPHGAAAAPAAWVPEQPLRILVGYPPGGAVDILVRVVGEGVQRLYGTPVVAEIRSGAYGFIAAQATAHAAPDGYTLCSAIMGMMCVLPAIPGVPVPLDLDKELTPVAALAGTPMALVVRPDAPFGDVDGLIAYAKQKNGAATYASSGNGSINHLGGALFCGATGVSMTHVPYRGGAPAILDITSGRVEVMFGNMPEFMGQIRDGGLRAVAYGAADASPLLPEVPVISRTGLPDFVIPNWFGVVMPGGASPALVQRWNAEINKALEAPEVQRRFTENGLQRLGGTREAFMQQIAADRARWGKVIREHNIRPE